LKHSNGRTLLYGLVAGCVLSAMRAPTGLDWTQLPAADAMTAAFVRAGALIAVALFLDARRGAFQEGFRAGPLLVAAAAGFALHGLLLGSLWQPESRLGLTGVLVGGALALRLAAGPPGERAREDLAARLPLFERLAIALAAAGATIALENLAHQVRLLGLGLPEDDTVIGTVFLVVLAVGAIAFGAWAARPATARLFPALGAAATAAATLAGLVFLHGMDPLGLPRYLERFDLDLSMIGGWRATGLLAAGGLVIPGFVAGTTLATAKHPGRAASLALGAAVGLVLGPLAVGGPSTTSIESAQPAGGPWAWNVLVLGEGMAVVGALVVALGERGARRWGGVLVCAALAVSPWLRPRLVMGSFSPWYVVPIDPVLAVATPAGVVTVERSRGDDLIVTVDRKRVSPTSDERGVDAMRLSYAWALLDRELRSSGTGSSAARVLLIGQMTPSRAHALRALGAIDVERTAPWFDALEAVEAVLFPPGDPPPGARVEPAEARRRIREGRYDLVVAMPTHGPVQSPKSLAFQPWGTVDAPATKGLDVPSGTVGVAWVDAASPLSSRALGERVLVAADRFQHPSIGLVRGEPTSLGAPTLFPAGAPSRRVSSWSLLAEFPRHRSFGLRRAVFDRLARAAAGSEIADLARGLALHYAAQKPSSPYETLAQQTEIEEEELRAFFAAAGSVPAGLDPFARDLWEGLAWLLTQKRSPDMVLVYVEPVAERHGPWPALDRAVAHAYRELLDPQGALRAYERVLLAEPNDAGSLVACGELRIELGDPTAGAHLLRQARTLASGDAELERRIGIALHAAGAPEGREILEHYLVEHPEDEEVLRQLTEGPAAPTPEGEPRRP